MLRPLLPLLLLLGCPALEFVEPPPWWSGPGAGLVADDDDLVDDDDDFADDDDFVGGDIAVVGLDEGDTMRLVGFEGTDDLTELTLEDVGRETKLQASSSMVFAMTGGASAQIVIGTFQPEYSSVSNPLPAHSDPADFVLGKECSMMVMQGSRSALVVPDGPSEMPFFADLSSYADEDGDPDALSGLRLGSRLFVGLARLGEAGPAPEGGLAVELDCEANVLETQVLGPGALLSAGSTKAILGVVLLADGTVHGFQPDDGVWQTDPIWEGEALERLVVSDEGAMWGVADSRLLCRHGLAEAQEIAGDLEPVVDLAVGASGRACVLSADTLRCWSAKGCATQGEVAVSLDAPGVELAVVTLGAE